MIAKRFPRATQPHFGTLSTALAPLLVTANAGSFHLSWDGIAVIVAQGGWDGVNQAAVQDTVTTAADETPALTAKDALGALNMWEEAIFRTLLNLINENRTALGKSTLSAGAFFNLVKTKIDTL